MQRMLTDNKVDPHALAEAFDQIKVKISSGKKRLY